MPAVTSPSATAAPAAGCRSTLMMGACSRTLGPAPKMPAPRRPRLPADRQRNGGAEDVTGIVAPLGGNEPFGIGTIAFCHTVRVVSDKKVRISTRKRHRNEGLTSGSSPLAMPLLLFLVRPIDEGGEDLDEHMVAAKPEGRCPLGHP